MLEYRYVRVEFFDLSRIRAGAYRTFCTQDAYFTGAGILPQDLSSRPDYAQYSFIAICQPGQVILLYGTQSLGRGSIAGQYHQRATLPEKPFHAFKGILIYGFKRTVAI